MKSAQKVRDADASTAATTSPVRNAALSSQKATLIRKDLEEKLRSGQASVRFFSLIIFILFFLNSSRYLFYKFQKFTNLSEEKVVVQMPTPGSVPALRKASTTSGAASSTPSAAHHGQQQHHNSQGAVTPTMG